MIFEMRDMIFYSFTHCTGILLELREVYLILNMLYMKYCLVIIFHKNRHINELCDYFF